MVHYQVCERTSDAVCDCLAVVCWYPVKPTATACMPQLVTQVDLRLWADEIVLSFLSCPLTAAVSHER